MSRSRTGHGEDNRSTRQNATLIIIGANHIVMKPQNLSVEEKQRLSGLIAASLSQREEVLFAYVCGSFPRGAFRDIDITVFLADDSNGIADPLRYETALEQELEDIAGVPIDVRVLNTAPLPFAYSVLKSGDLLLSRDERARCDFACRTYTHYHDFAYYRKRYRREALGLLR